MAMFWTGSKQFVYGAATLAVLVVLTIGLVLYFRDIGLSTVGHTSAEGMYRGGPQRTGVYDVKGPKRGELLWQFTTGGVMGAAPTVVDGVAYVGSHDGFLYAVDSQTGQEKWKFETGRPVISAPAVADGIVYFGSGCIGGGPQGCGDPPDSYYYFYALDLQTGQEKWRFGTSGAVVSSPLFGDGVVYFGSEDQYLYAVDGQTGREKWRFKTEDALWSSPALADGVVYVGTGCDYCGSSENRHLYAVDSQTGQELWRFETGGWVESTPAVADGTVYVGSGDRNVYAVESQTGQEKWRFQTESRVFDSPAVGDGVLYAAGADGNLYALDSQTGGELWKFETGGPMHSGPAIADGVAYVGSNDRYLYAVEAQTGQELWRFQAFRGMRGSPVVGDGVVYFTSEDANLYAVGDPEAVASDDLEETDQPIAGATLQSPPLGTYVTKITTEDGLHYGLVGTWELILAEENRWSQTHLGSFVAEGRYSLTPDQIVATHEKEYTQICSDIGAETGTYKWAFDGQVLTLTTVEDECLDRNKVWTAHPWSKQD
jgi:outer membrane protein assembly factor BamB